MSLSCIRESLSCSFLPTAGTVPTAQTERGGGWRGGVFVESCPPPRWHGACRENNQFSLWHLVPGLEEERHPQKLMTWSDPAMGGTCPSSMATVQWVTQPRAVECRATDEGTLMLCSCLHLLLCILEGVIFVLPNKTYVQLVYLLGFCV